MENNVYRNEDGIVVTDSMKIAEAFGMRHGTVLEKARVFISLNYEEYKEEVFEDIRKAVNGSKKYFQFTWSGFQGFIKTFTSPHAEKVFADFKAEFWGAMHEGMVPVEHEDIETPEVVKEPEEKPLGAMVEDEKKFVTTAELLLKMAETLVEQERHIKMLEEKIALTARTIAESITFADTKSVEEVVDANFKNMAERDEIKKLVEAYAEARFISIGQAWGYMYSVLHTETGVIIAGREHGYTSKIHEVECKGLLPRLLDICRRLTGKK